MTAVLDERHPTKFLYIGNTQTASQNPDSNPASFLFSNPLYTPDDDDLVVGIGLLDFMCANSFNNIQQDIAVNVLALYMYSENQYSIEGSTGFAFILPKGCYSYQSLLSFLNDSITTQATADVPVNYTTANPAVLNAPAELPAPFYYAADTPAADTTVFFQDPYQILKCKLQYPNPTTVPPLPTGVVLTNILIEQNEALIELGFKFSNAIDPSQPDLYTVRDGMVYLNGDYGSQVFVNNDYTTIGQEPVSFGGPYNLYMGVNFSTQSFGPSQGFINGKNILDRIPIDASKGGISQYIPPIVIDRYTSGIANRADFAVTFYDDYGDQVDFNGGIWAATLRVSYYKSQNYIDQMEVMQAEAQNNISFGYTTPNTTLPPTIYNSMKQLKRGRTKGLFHG